MPCPATGTAAALPIVKPDHFLLDFHPRLCEMQLSTGGLYVPVGRGDNGMRGPARGPGRHDIGDVDARHRPKSPARGS